MTLSQSTINRLLEAALQHQQAVNQYLLHRNRFNAERRYRACNERYFEFQDQWSANRVEFMQLPEAVELDRSVLALQRQVEDVHG